MVRNCLHLILRLIFTDKRVNKVRQCLIHDCREVRRTLARFYYYYFGSRMADVADVK